MRRPSQKTIDQYNELAEIARAQNEAKKTKKKQARHSLHSKRMSGLGASQPFMKYAAELANLDEDVAPLNIQETKAEAIPAPEYPDLFDDLRTMLELSSLIYAFAFMRKVVKDGGVKNSSWWPFAGRTQLPNADLIEALWDEKDTTAGRHRKIGGVLQHPISAEDIGNFMSNETVQQFSNDAEIASTLNINGIQTMSKLGRQAHLWEFDDHFADSQLVYGITVNRYSRRVTIVFRGSVVGADWMTNIKFVLKEMKTPDALKPTDADLDGPVKVHSGFKSYLLDDQIEENPALYDRENIKKYGQIVENLRTIYNYEEGGKKVHAGFNLYVTGHSLGGALCTLLCFKLGGSKKMEELNIPLPLTCISYASPYVGDRNFQKAFEALEKLGRVRHLRVSNKHDVVPVAPPGGYMHTGVNLHLEEDGDYEIGYPNKKSWTSQTRPWSVNRHMVVDYYARGQAVEEWYVEKLQEGAFEAWHVESVYKYRGLLKRTSIAIEDPVK